MANIYDERFSCEADYEIKIYYPNPDSSLIYHIAVYYKDGRKLFGHRGLSLPHDLLIMINHKFRGYKHVRTNIPTKSFIDKDMEGTDWISRFFHIETVSCKGGK